MKNIVRLSLVLLLPLMISCVAPREVSQTACNDPKYLALLSKPVDSLTSREFEYMKMKDQECEQSKAGASFVEQSQIGESETMILLAAINIAAVIVLIALR